MEGKQFSPGPAPRIGRGAGTPGFVARRAPSALAATLLAAAALAPGAASAAPAGEAIAAAASGAGASVRSHYERLRAQLKWVPTRVGSREVLTPDGQSRLLLARSAAQRAGLAEVGLDFRDVYGVISAETSWVPRDGMGRNGVVSQGLAQLEPATARALGVRNANDPVEAVHAAATLLKEAAQWSARRIGGLQLDRAERAARLREGVSIYYNLSSAARARWNGISSASLPVETQRHIRNVREGVRQAEQLVAGGRIELPAALAAAAPAPAAQLVAAAAAPAAAPRRVAAASRPAALRPVGTVEWSGTGSNADGRRTGKYIVWSDGSMTRASEGRVRWTSSALARNG